MKAWRELSPSIESLGRIALEAATIRESGNYQPPRELVFRAFEMIRPENVRAVILGLDPYPTKGHAMGLAFSIPDGVSAAKTFKNIAKEYEADLGYPMQSTDLTPWVESGVLLANVALTVKTGEPKTHLDLWRRFTEEWVSGLARSGGSRVWVLWGNDAQEFRTLIESAGEGAQMVIESPHPSPLAAWRGFFGSKPFSKTNQLLAASGSRGIDWKLPVVEQQGTLFT